MKFLNSKILIFLAIFIPIVYISILTFYFLLMQNKEIEEVKYQLFFVMRDSREEMSLGFSSLENKLQIIDYKTDDTLDNYSVLSKFYLFNIKENSLKEISFEEASKINIVSAEYRFENLYLVFDYNSSILSNLFFINQGLSPYLIIDGKKIKLNIEELVKYNNNLSINSFQFIGWIEN